MILADIATGDTGTADVLFLIAAILFGLAAILHLIGAYPRPAPAEPAARGGWGWGWTTIFVDAGLCLVALGLMLQ
jgi:hypothetical protein